MEAFQVSQLESELEKLKKEEMLLTQELKDLKLENLHIDEELANQQTARELLEKQEEEYWKQYSHHKQQLCLKGIFRLERVELHGINS